MGKTIKRLSKPNSNKGMTLVEVLVSIMILTILVVAFTNLIGWNFFSIFSMGEKSKAIAKAVEKTDQLNALVWNADDAEAAEAALQDPANGWVDFNDLPEEVTEDCVYSFTKVTDREIDGTLVDGYDVTVVVFYHDFKFHVKLDSFILQSPEQI
ncbi:prepilin-type N-terminal cleavage/methylation domain-containing protein [Desulfotomaculum arcticum]|uniref:Prepilin-type N-terminal cleavage/methylation domain-containing protein n=1 Tax=Desulfotruncus arcticus DSM 17038 TaxID=1121424 RepID=A0A1I2MQD5_9FIRM|nr:type II secretion system protein [Desulfotruncus arcticus]SFF92909.1 prepilin-type N-terminal cleavage/methylation domain-containing protein [Desulfotomaculum arcticum] [Desulfotruncus arcticus DSM 17038]